MNAHSIICLNVLIQFITYLILSIQICQFGWANQMGLRLSFLEPNISFTQQKSTLKYKTRDILLSESHGSLSSHSHKPQLNKNEYNQMRLPLHSSKKNFPLKVQRKKKKNLKSFMPYSCYCNKKKEKKKCAGPLVCTQTLALAWLAPIVLHILLSSFFL